MAGLSRSTVPRKPISRGLFAPSVLSSPAMSYSRIGW
jgi:hypothetical protein